MKDRGKSLVEKPIGNNNNNYFSEFNYSVPDLPCRKHPIPSSSSSSSSSSSVGICAQCLKDRLLKLVCSDCGEQRLSSCSCSEPSSNRNSCSVDVGSVGRISFLLENENNPDHNPHSKPKTQEKSEEILTQNSNLPLKRSRSSCIGGKKSGIWRIGRFFRKKKDDVKGNNDALYVFDKMRVSRSRSLCSFRGHGDEVSSEFALSSAKISDFNGGTLSDFCARGSLDSVNECYGTKIKASDVNAMDECRFIDLKLDLSLDSIPKLRDVSDSDFGSSFRSGNFVGNNQIEDDEDEDPYNNGGSCRITINDREMKKCSKGHKVWRWIFRHQNTSGKKGENHHSLKL